VFHPQKLEAPKHHGHGKNACHQKLFPPFHIPYLHGSKILYYHIILFSHFGEKKKYLAFFVLPANEYQVSRGTMENQA
jgi:hypothetical protein